MRRVKTQGHHLKILHQERHRKMGIFRKTFVSPVWKKKIELDSEIPAERYQGD